MAFIEYTLAVKSLLHSTNLFSPNGYKKIEKIIYKYFKEKYVKSRVSIGKYRWNKKLFFTRNKS